MRNEATGKDIHDAFKQLRRFCQDIALLLSTSDTLMKDYGWEPWGGSGALGDGSGSLDRPRWWIPWGAFRIYTHPERKHLLSYVCVLFDHPDKEEKMKEPLATAGQFDWGEGGEVGEWRYMHTRCHLFNKGRRDDGEVVECGPEENAANGRSFQEMKSVALPLVQVTDAEVLKDRILDKVFAAEAI